MSSNDCISSITIEQRRYPLTQPYDLSFVSLTEFEALIAFITLKNGRVLTGEVVPLPGYSFETPDDVIQNITNWRLTLEGIDLISARQWLVNQIQNAPFASSLLLSALDSDLLMTSDIQPDYRAVPIVHPVAANSQDVLPSVSQAVANGYRTIKVKVGHDLTQDLQILSLLRTVIPPQVTVRFDANQAYTLNAAKKFLSAVERELPEATELVEQPLSPDAWSEMALLSNYSKIPLMLDESIRTMDDVTRAAEIGCKLIKLKLCKQGGIQEVLNFTRHAVSLGLKVVLGNGVATDISNILELWLYARNEKLFSGASESNGFVKLRKPVKYLNLKVDSGRAVW